MRVDGLDTARLFDFCQFWVLKAPKEIKPSVCVDLRPTPIAERLNQLSVIWFTMFNQACLIGRLNLETQRSNVEFREVVYGRPLPKPREGFVEWLAPSPTEQGFALLAMAYQLREQLLNLKSSRDFSRREQAMASIADRRLCQRLSDLTGVNFLSDRENALLPDIVHYLMQIAAIKRYGPEVARLVVEEGDREGFFIGDEAARKDSSAIDYCYDVGRSVRP